MAVDVLDTRNVFLGVEERLHWFVRLLLLVSLTAAPVLGSSLVLEKDKQLVQGFLISYCFQEIAIVGCILGFVAKVMINKSIPRSVLFASQL
jgi:hypothetical protein